MGHTGTGPIGTSNGLDWPPSSNTFGFVSRQRDNYIQDIENHKPHWHAYLTNGEEVFDDDGRLNLYNNPLPASWIRLKEYCESKNIGIDRIYLRFRSHYEHIEKADGYMFKRGSLGSPGMKTRNFFVIGRVVKDKIYVQKWKIPELIVEEEDIRDLKDNLEWTILKGG